MKQPAPIAPGDRPGQAPAGISRILTWGLLLLTLFPLAVYMYLGNYVRYFADDYSAAGDLFRLGFWKAQINWYLNWTGSYFYTFMASAASLGGVAFTRWLPAIALLLWGVLLYLALRLIFRTLKFSVSGSWIVILSGTIAFTTIRGFDDFTQIIFWQTGIVAYLSNILIFLLITIYFVHRFWSSSRRVQYWEYGVMFVIFFLMGGSSETWIIMQVVLFAVAILAAFLFRKKLPHPDLLPMLFAGFAASCLSFLVTLVAPGNSTHSSTMEELSIQRIVKYLFVSFGDVFRFLIEWANRRTLLVILITLTGFLCGFQAHRQEDQITRVKYLEFGGGLLVFAFLMLWMGFFPGYTVFGVRPPDRAIFTSMFILLLAYALVCFLIGWITASFLSAHVQGGVYVLLALMLAVLMYLLPVQTGLSQIKLIPALRLYGRLWDERDAFLKRASREGQMDVVIPSIRYHPELGSLKPTIWLLGELEEEPTNWKNNAASIYYGLHSITGQKDPPSYEFK